MAFETVVLITVAVIVVAHFPSIADANGKLIIVKPFLTNQQSKLFTIRNFQRCATLQERRVSYMDIPVLGDMGSDQKLRLLIPCQPEKP